MRFAIARSPFQNIHKFADEDLLDYLDPHLRELAWQFRAQHKASVPPFAFVFGKTEGVYLSGYNFSTPESFVLQVKYDAKMLKALRVLLCVEVRSVIQSDVPESLLLTEVQAPNRASLRCAYDLLRPGRKDVSADWSLPPDMEEEPETDNWDPVARMIDSASRASRIMGPGFFVPIFGSNPADSTPVPKD